MQPAPKTVVVGNENVENVILSDQRTALHKFRTASEKYREPKKNANFANPARLGSQRVSVNIARVKLFSRILDRMPCHARDEYMCNFRIDKHKVATADNCVGPLLVRKLFRDYVDLACDQIKIFVAKFVKVITAAHPLLQFDIGEMPHNIFTVAQDSQFAVRKLESRPDFCPSRRLIGHDQRLDPQLPVKE